MEPTHYIKDIKLIEGVQHRATKLVQGMERLQYDDSLKPVSYTHLTLPTIYSV